MASTLRWVAIAVFLLSSTLNYLDRQLLAAMAPQLRAEFHLTNEDYGLLLLAFSLAYAFMAPFAGLFIDRAGLNTGIGVAVACWSLAGMATGMVHNFAGLFAARAALGAAEAAGIPGTGKANAMYLESHELSLGTAMNQIGLSLGGVAAPLLAGFAATRYGWRPVFVVCGLLGFLWIPLWLVTARRIPHRERARGAATISPGGMLADRRFHGIVIANLLYMTMYTLWTNWTTVYFVEARGLSQAEANRQFAWIPPVFATLGGFAGGAIAFRLIRGGMPVFSARMRVCLLSAVLLLATAAVPAMPSAFWAAAVISFSFFWVTAMSTQIYVMPIDFFGPGRAAFGVAALTFAYGIMQAVVSPAIGRMIDRFGFASVCYALAPLPLVAVAVLKGLCDAGTARDAR
jgi:ACS family hexuronate transporter-like MFS transporter